MLKYLKLFNTHSQYIDYSNGDMLLPNVSHCIQENEMHYSPMHDYSHDYLTFVSLADNNVFTFKSMSNNTPEKTISVSIDNGVTWTDYTNSFNGTIIGTLNTNEKMLIKGENDCYSEVVSSVVNVRYFKSSDEFKIEGNIMSLIYGDNFVGQTEITEPHTFQRLFDYNDHLKSAKNLILPSTVLTQVCYASMFNGCTSLTAAPELPATTLASGCYRYMFQGCTSLTAAPELPATTLASNCYSQMFQTTAITSEPNVPSVFTSSNPIGANYCGYMFCGTSLTYDFTTSKFAIIAYNCNTDTK